MEWYDWVQVTRAAPPSDTEHPGLVTVAQTRRISSQSNLPIIQRLPADINWKIETSLFATKWRRHLLLCGCDLSGECNQDTRAKRGWVTTEWRGQPIRAQERRSVANKRRGWNISWTSFIERQISPEDNFRMVSYHLLLIFIVLHIPKVTIK